MMHRPLTLFLLATGVGLVACGGPPRPVVDVGVAFDPEALTPGSTTVIISGEPDISGMTAHLVRAFEGRPELASEVIVNALGLELLPLGSVTTLTSARDLGISVEKDRLGLLAVAPIEAAADSSLAGRGIHHLVVIGDLRLELRPNLPGNFGWLPIAWILPRRDHRLSLSGQVLVWESIRGRLVGHTFATGEVTCNTVEPGDVTDVAGSFARDALDAVAIQH